MSDVILFDDDMAKAIQQGGAMRDLFQEWVPVSGHTRGGKQVRPSVARRHKRHVAAPIAPVVVAVEPEGDDYGVVPVAPSLADFPDEDVIAEAKVRLEAQLFARHDADALSSPDATRDYAKLKLARGEYETFNAIWLDNLHRPLKWSEMFRGTIDGASVHPREVVKEALAMNAAAVIFVHNHPSGVTEPSQSDLRITQRLKDALSMVEVRLLDHLIVGEGDTVSLAERKLV